MMKVSMKFWVTWTALCIAVILNTSVSAGGASGKKSEVMSAANVVNYYFSIEIMNRIFNDSLLNPESVYYKKMYNEVSSAFDSVFEKPEYTAVLGYQGIREMGFSKGSVIANTIIVFNGPINNPIFIKNLFLEGLDANNSIKGLEINPASVNDSKAKITPPSPTTTTMTTTTTTPTTTTTTTPTTTTTTTPTTTTTTTPTTTTTTTPTTTPTTPTTTQTTTQTTTLSTTTKNTTPTTTPTTTLTTTKTSTPTTTTTSKTSTTPERTSKHSSTPPIPPPTKPPKPNSSTTISTPSSNTTIHRSMNNSTTHTTTTTPSSDHGEGVPGWAIALLVLAAVAILLLIIIIIILLVRWCCVDNGDDDVRSLPPQEHTPYMRTTFREPLSVPAYSPHTPQKNLYPFDDLTQSPKPKPNRTGTYVVTPERRREK